jgi:DNA repair protein RadA/Sms
MKKISSKYVCQQCEYESTRWMGKCPECATWGGLVETVVSSPTKGVAKNSQRADGNVSSVTSLTSITSDQTERTSSKIYELDRVLGGGVVSGQVILIAGEPGIGKSTLLLQLADNLATDTSPFLYVSGEESEKQIKLRADRLGIKNKNILLLEETDIDNVIATALSSPKPSYIIIDSIQTMQTTDLSGMSGAVGQVRECAYRLVRLAKSNNIPVFIVGHVTKEGSVAGPSVLKHIVDTVLWFEGDKTLALRMVRAVKNRFGPTDELGIFSMEEKGLIPVESPEKMFLGNKISPVPGSVLSAIVQGSRTIMVEIQALIVPTKLPVPRRVAQGVDAKRLELLLAVLTRRCGLPFYESDCFVNVSGGIDIGRDPSVDLAICMAIASSYFDHSLSQTEVYVGEVDLLGVVRSIPQLEKRIKEVKRMGYSLHIDPTKGDLLRTLINKLHTSSPARKK